MPVKTLLTVHPVDDPIGQLDEIIDLARRLDAHLNVVVLGLIVPIPATVYGLGVDVVWKERPGSVRDHVARETDEIERMVSDADVSATIISEFPEVGAIDRVVAKHSLYADLTVFPHGKVLHEATTNDIFQGVLHATGRAALVLGENTTPIPAERAMVAWDGSPEAARAVREALPFLAPGCEVRILAVDPNVAKTGPQAGNDIASYLARHDCKVEVERVPGEGRRPGEVILEQVVDTDAQLLVMGAFAHPRIRQWLIGGATQDVMAKVKINVLTAH